MVTTGPVVDGHSAEDPKERAPTLLTSLSTGAAGDPKQRLPGTPTADAQLSAGAND
jgi:hypothetical protein